MTPQEIATKLKSRFSDAQVEVQDLTGGGDHYEVVVQSAAFEGMSRILRHRTVMQVFDAELKSGEVHALTIKTLVPGDTKSPTKTVFE